MFQLKKINKLKFYYENINQMKEKLFSLINNQNVVEINKIKDIIFSI